MKIMKTSIMRKGILLLTFVMMLVLLAAASVFAAGDPDLTISVVYDPNQCTVYLTYDGLETGKEVMDPDGKSVNVPYGSKELKLSVEPVMGYALTSIEDMDNPGNSLMEPYDNCYYAASFLSSVRAKVECSPKVFDVKFEKADVTTLPYNPVSGDKGELYGLKYHYMQQGNLTVLPEVYRDGYTFQYWQVIYSTGEEMVRITEKNEDGKYYLSHTLINTDMVLNGTIYLHAEFTPDPQKVTRYDYVWKQDTETGAWGQDKRLGTYLWEAPMDTQVSALTPMGEELANDGSINYKSYPGYTLYMDYPYKTSPITLVSEKDDNPNEFTRYYTPIVYALDYQLDGGVLPEGACTTYVYDTRTPISQPTRRGYIFDGWIVMVDGNQVGEKTATDFVLGILDAEGNAQYAAEDGKIVLIAQWVPETYTITYQWGDVPAELIPSLDAWNATLPQTFQFNQADFFIPNPFRAGYQFAGWTLTYTNGSEVNGESGLTAGEGKYYLDSTVHTTNITLTASWTVESYKVALDGQGATNEFTNEIPSVTYDAEWSLPDGFVIPLKDGFEFDGYWSALEGGERYINADGTINAEKLKWDLDDADNAGVITFYARWIRKSYSITVTISGLPAGTNPTIEILVGNTFYPNGVELPFETEYKVKITMPDGFKLVAWNGEAMDPTTMFESDTFTVGATMQAWGAESRPQAPTYGGDGAVTSIEKSDTQIKVTMNPDVAHLYEFAILRNNNPENLTAEDWKQIVGDQNYYLFENLQPGTTYYVFVRLQENGEVPPGIIYVHSATVTNHETYVNNVKDALDNMLTDNDGDIANAVIEEIKDEIDTLVGNENFFEEVEKLIASVEAKLALARFQDSKIAELEAFLDDCFQSGSFNTANKDRLSDICEVAVTKISSAGKTEDVEELFDTAMAEMKAIPVSYLHDATGTIQLSTLLGLGQNGGISLNSIEDIKALRRAVSDAIAQGKITADSFITIEEAKELIRALDTVSAYNFYLTNVQPAEGDSFVFHMLIPEALAGRTGLQVAYYNAATGTVELLETTVEGNMLVFRAKQVADFVIMADPTVDLTGVIIALGVIVLCQLIAIILVLAARSKAKNAIKHASVALPMFLTIYFQPANSEMIALGLGALALILQIVLMWLLISSGMIRVFKPKKSAPTRQKPAPRKQTLQNESAAVPAGETQAPMGSLVIEEEDLEEEYVENEQTLGEDAFDEGLADELAHEQAENGSFAETEEVYDDEEFIEHAPNPYYSLDDEEDVYAYNQKETERVSDVDATGQETQETSYGADPIDGVFGEAYVQDGYSGDEGGDPYYAESDAGAYDYADETDAAQFESEILEGEETSDEGSIDPTAYVVNDDEEYSEEEEMYRYDE